MKLKELKHNHSLTDLLKILIFSVLMITPLLSVATRCLYVICNKNAYESYSGNVTTNEYVDINNLPKYDLLFSFNSNLELNNFSGNDNKFYLTNIEYIEGNLTQTQIDSFGSATYIQIWGSTNNYLTTNSIGINLNSNIYYFTIKCDVISFFTTTYTNNIINNLFYKKVAFSTLDNVFEYSVNKLQESQIINWTTNTGVYTGVNAMTTQLGIEGAVIPMLITYWFLLTIIYVIIDIVLKLFTVLTHLIGSKTT